MGDQINQDLDEDLYTDEENEEEHADYNNENPTFKSEKDLNERRNKTEKNGTRYKELRKRDIQQLDGPAAKLLESKSNSHESCLNQQTKTSSNTAVDQPHSFQSMNHEKKEDKTEFNGENSTKDATQKNTDERKSLVTYLFILLAFGVAFAAFATNFHSYIFDIPKGHLYNDKKIFMKNIQNSFEKFPEQYPETKKLIQNVGLDHLIRVFNMDKKDLRPVSFLIAGYAGSEKTMNCFVNELGNAFTHSPFQKINASVYLEKEKLDSKIRNSLGKQQKFVVIQNIEKLPFKTAQLFMSYSDSYNDLATYPQSLLVLTTILPFPFNSETSSRKSDERRVEKHFVEHVWKGQGPLDTVAPLWTRVGDGLVLLKKSESECKLNDYDIDDEQEL